MRFRLAGKGSVPPYETLLLICCFVTFSCYFGSYMRMPVVPLFAKSLGADTIQVGLINSTFLFMAGLFSLPLGILSDRLGRKKLMLGGLLISSCTSLLLYFSRTPNQMIWIYLVFGIGLAAFAPTMMSFVADFSPLTHLGRSYGWYTTALYGGMTLGPAAGGFTAQRYGFIQSFLISGAIIFLVFWIVLLFLPRARHVLVNRPPKRGTLISAKSLLKNRPLVACWLVTLGGCFGLGMFVTFMPLYAQEQGMSVGQIGIIFGTQALVNALSRIPFGYIGDRVSRRSNLVVIGLVGFAVSMAGFGVSDTLSFFVLFAILLGISMGLCFTAVGALIAQVVPPESRGLAMGGYNTCIYIGMMLSSAIMGAAILKIGFTNGFYLTGLINFISLGIFIIIVRNSPLTAASSPI